MSGSESVTRRSLLKVVGAGLCVAAAGAAGCEAPAARTEPTRGIAFKNADFYDAAGKFNVDAGKEAVIAVMKYHGYPVFKDMKQKLWVSDYGLGEFTKLGLAACLFQNNEKDRYMLMDLYLLPGQMLPEHWHLETPKNPAKLEGWLVRHGLSHIVGEGEPNLGADVVVPRCHMDGTVTVRHETAARPGDFVPLVRVTSRHWQMAGPEGAIITEVANVHDNDGVRHSDPKVVFP